MSVKGGVGKVIEFTAARAWPPSPCPSAPTITNMGAELGATTSIFPADEQTRAFFDQAMGRPEDEFEPSWWPDEGAEYDEEIVEIDLSKPSSPWWPQPHMPDQCLHDRASELAGKKVDQSRHRLVHQLFLLRTS